MCWWKYQNEWQDIFDYCTRLSSLGMEVYSEKFHTKFNYKIVYTSFN